MKLFLSLVCVLLINGQNHNIKAQTTVISFLSSTEESNLTDYEDSIVSSEDSKVVLKKMVSYCTSSKIRLVGQTIDFSWTVEGFLNYFYAMDGQFESRFDEINITNVKFETLTGKWVFAIGIFENDTEVSVKAVYETRNAEEHDMTFDGQMNVRINGTSSLYLGTPTVTRRKCNATAVEPLVYKFEDDHPHPGDLGKQNKKEKDHHHKKNEQKHQKHQQQQLPSNHPESGKRPLPTMTKESEFIELKWGIGGGNFYQAFVTPLQNHDQNDQFDLVFRLNTLKKLTGGKSEVSRDCDVEEVKSIISPAQAIASFGVNKHRYTYSTTDASSSETM